MLLFVKNIKSNLIECEIILLESDVRKTKTLIQLQFTIDSPLQLRGHQSVRTTFKLSERCIDALGILAVQLGIKQKTLFDHLVDDVHVLKTIAKEFDSMALSDRRVAKTYVISRRTLENLELISSKYNTPRDALVELSIERILPLIEHEKAKHVQRTEITEKLTEQLRQISKLLLEAESELGEDDQVVQEMYNILRTSDVSLRRIRAFLEKGKKIEQF